MDYNSLEYDREINNLLPWEPIVRSDRETYEENFVANDHDHCECCGVEIPDGKLVVSNNRRVFCTWECLLIVANDYPDQFVIVDRGAF